MPASWNDTGRSTPAGLTLPQLFEEQAARTPESPALTFEGETLSYADLDARANRLAWYLRERGIGPEARVALVLERSLDLVVGILGILKAGGAWVPIAPDYPAERIAWMLEDSAAPLLLTDSATAASLPPTGAEVVCLDQEARAVGRHDSSCPPRSLSPDDLAYVIYTSGSTGKPKGAMVIHRGVCSRLLWQREDYGIDGRDVFLQKAPIGFDVSVWEMFVPLVSGARLVLARPGLHMDPEYLVRAIEEHRITSIQFVPSVLRLFLEALPPDACGSLRQVFSGGEALPLDLQEQFFARHPAALHNFYGPTETSGAVTHWTCERASARGSVPIGRPVANTRIYVLDERLQPVPIGSPGELCVGGIQVGRGYLNRPDLTAERFVPDPFACDAEARLYRTGDLARWQPDGTLEYLGRTDNQIKLRGVRMELGEIEAALRAQPEIDDAVVVARDARGDLVTGGVADELVAFIVTSESVASDDLQHRLQRVLPAPMIPPTYITLDEIPLSPNGKADRRALRLPDRGTLRADRTIKPPGDEVERWLVATWRELLGIDELSVDEDFFQVGGHSLLAVRLFTRIRKKFRLDLPLAVLVQAPTIEMLAGAIRQRTATAMQGQEQRPADGDGRARSNSDWQCLVPIRPGGTRPPLYCVHAIGGNVLTFFELARYLDAEQPLYGLQAVGVDGLRPPLSRIEDMAAKYIREIQSVQPTGPYYLAGYCAGGAIAFEMARQLQQQGHEIGQLILFDAWNPDAMRETWTAPPSAEGPAAELSRLGRHVAALRSNGPLHLVSWLRRRVTFELGRIARLVRSAGWIARKKAAAVQFRLGKPVDYDLRWEMIREGMYNALDAYRVKELPVPGVIFVASADERPWARGSDTVGVNDLGWGGFIMGELAVHEFPCTNDALFTEPFVRELAPLLQRRLNTNGGSHPRRAPLHRPVAVSL